MYKNKKNFVQKIKLKKYLDLFKFSTQNFRLKDKQKYQYFIVKMIFNLNKFVLRNNLQKMSIENLTNALGLVNRLLGLFLKFQKFFRLKKYKLLQYYRFQYQSSSLIIYLSFINQIEWESTYEFFFFPEELKQDKNLKRIKKFNHVTSFFKRKSNVYKNKKKNYNFDQKDIFLVLDFRKLKKKVYLDFLLLKKKSKFFFFFGLQYLQLYIYLKFLLLLFNDNIVNTKNNFLLDFFFIRFIFLRLIQFSIKRQILWKFFYIRRLRINSKIRRKLFLFGFFQVMQLKKKIKNFIFSNMNYINVFYKLIFIKNKKQFKKNKKKYFFAKNIKNIHKINKKNNKSFSFKSLKK